MLFSLTCVAYWFHKPADPSITRLMGKDRANSYAALAVKKGYIPFTVSHEIRVCILINFVLNQYILYTVITIYVMS